jgi:hypothetical protein
MDSSGWIIYFDAEQCGGCDGSCSKFRPRDDIPVLTLTQLTAAMSGVAIHLTPPLHS